jgi:hypothetical protein
MMIRQCSNCKYAYSKCHDRMKEHNKNSMYQTACCNHWESNEPKKKEEDKDKKKKGWW